MTVVDKKPIKNWLLNGSALFFSMAMVAIKALWDTYWLSRVDDSSFIAFAFIFPLIIVINMVAMSLANATIATFSRLSWVNKNENQVDTRIFTGLTLAAVLLGIVVSGAIWLLVPWLTQYLAANAYQLQLELFAQSLIIWLPLQFVVAVWMNIARGLGQFSLSGKVATSCHLLGMIVSYWLLTQLTPLTQISQISQLPPLVAIVYSNAFISLLTIALAAVLIFRQSMVNLNIKYKALPECFIQPFLSVFGSSFIANIFALVFIFSLTRLMAQQGEQVIAAMVYLTRLEQLVLIFFSAFIGVMLPDVAHLVREKQWHSGLNYIRHGGRFLALFGLGLIGVLYLVVWLVGSQMVATPEIYQQLVYLAGFWFIGLLMQGPFIFYLQLINVVIAPKLAVKINFVRFIVFAVPLIYLAGVYWGLLGILLCLPVIHAGSLTVVLLLFKQRWQQLTLAND